MLDGEGLLLLQGVHHGGEEQGLSEQLGQAPAAIVLLLHLPRVLTTTAQHTHTDTHTHTHTKSTRETENHREFT